LLSVCVCVFLLQTALAFDIVTEKDIEKRQAVSAAKDIELVIPTSTRIDSKESSKQPQYMYGTTQLETRLQSDVQYYIVPSLAKRKQQGTYYLTVFSDVEFELEGGICTTAEKEIQRLMVGPNKIPLTAVQLSEKKEGFREKLIEEVTRLKISEKEIDAMFNNAVPSRTSIERILTEKGINAADYPKDDKKFRERVWADKDTLKMTDKDIDLMLNMSSLSRAALKRKLVDSGFNLADFPDDDFAVLDINNDGTITKQEFMSFFSDGIKMLNPTHIPAPPAEVADDLLFQPLDLEGTLSVQVCMGKNVKMPVAWFNASAVVASEAAAHGNKSDNSSGGAALPAAGAAAAPAPGGKKEPVVPPPPPPIAADTARQPPKKVLFKYDQEAALAAYAKGVYAKPPVLKERDIFGDDSKDAGGVSAAAAAKSGGGGGAGDSKAEAPKEGFAEAKSPAFAAKPDLTINTGAVVKKADAKGPTTPKPSNLSPDRAAMRASASVRSALGGVDASYDNELATLRSTDGRVAAEPNSAAQQALARVGLDAGVKLHKDQQLQKAEVARTGFLSRLRATTVIVSKNTAEDAAANSILLKKQKPPVVRKIRNSEYDMTFLGIKNKDGAADGTKTREPMTSVRRNTSAPTDMNVRKGVVYDALSAGRCIDTTRIPGEIICPD
jgi:hypothetical protein